MKTPKFWYKDNSTLKYILNPLTIFWIFGNYLRKKYSVPKKFNVPIVCVGNAIAGGGGKTPLTMELAKLFIKKNYDVHIIKKQYKSKNKQDVKIVHKSSDPFLVGDESVLISRATKTWLAKNRKVGIEKAIKEGASLIILDDGYQDYSVIKDFNILTINENQQFGNTKIIPAGPLREKVEDAIQKADSIFFYGNKNSLDPSILRSTKPITFVKMILDKVVIKKIKNKKILAFSGIAHPQNFFNALTGNGLKLKRIIEFSDHYRYTINDFEKIILISSKLNLLAVTTEKDYVKVPKKFKENIIAIPVKLQFNQELFYNLFIKKVKEYV